MAEESVGNTVDEVETDEALAEAAGAAGRASGSTGEDGVEEQEDNKQYGKKEYWEKRFAEEESYEWLLSYRHVKGVLDSCVDKQGPCLVVGCGNSSFSLDLTSDGFERVVSTDYSEVVIEAMKQRTPPREGLSWEVADMLSLEQYPDESFASVLDKAAMDALMVDEGSVWQPDTSVVQRAHQMCSSVNRVLKPGGVFVQISFAQPHFRTKYLNGHHARHCIGQGQADSLDASGGERGGDGAYGWALDTHEVTKEEEDGGGGGCFGYFAYVMRKAGGARKGEEEPGQGGG